MARTEAFERYPDKYEQWFQRHQFAYRTELAAVKRIIPLNGRGIEIGVGSGRFAAPLGIPIGIEPSQSMIRLAAQRGLRVIRGVAEFLPIANAVFDYVLMITTICFLDDTEKALGEAYRIVKEKGWIILGLVDKESLIGKAYSKDKNKNIFYTDADFFSADQVVSILTRVGFHDFSFYQTLHKPLKDIYRVDRIEAGYGTGSFVIMKGEK